MKQSGQLNHSEETRTGCPVTSKYGRTPPNKHGGVGGQHHECMDPGEHLKHYNQCLLDDELYKCNKIHCFIHIYYLILRYDTLQYTTIHYTTLYYIHNIQKYGILWVWYMMVWFMYCFGKVCVIV